MDTAFIATWKTPLPGREEQALKYAAEAAEFWGKQAAEGRCTAPESFFFPNGEGMWMVKGESDVLYELSNSDEVRRLLMRGQLLLQDWQWSFAQTGPAAERFMTEYAAEVASI